MKRLSEPVYAVMRVIAGLMFAMHGAQKLFSFPVASPHPVALASQVGVGGVIELVCGLLIAVGLFTRVAAFIASGTMAVAYFQFHWKLSGGTKIYPLVNMGE